MSTTIEKIWQQFTSQSTHTALWENGKHNSYQDLGLKSRRLASHIAQLGAYKQTIAFFTTRDTSSYLALLGTLFSGNTLLPLNPSLPTIRQNSILESADCRYIIASKKQYKHLFNILSNLERLELHIIWLDDSLIQELQPVQQNCSMTYSQSSLSHTLEPLAKLIPAENAYLLFTSGTTGIPKGILISHNNLDYYNQHLSQHYLFSSEDRFGQHADLTFDLSVHDWSLAWSNGASLYAIPSMLKSCPTDFIRRHQLTCWLSVPNVIPMSITAGKLVPESLPSLRLSFFCGQALSQDHANSWFEATKQLVINLYGPTEATIAISLHEYDPQTEYSSTFLPIGHIFNNQKFKLLPVKHQTEYELLLNGEQVISQYWKSPNADKKAFYSDDQGHHWYRTGDLVSQEHEHGLIYHGRIDQQVKLGGHRIELAEIEALTRNAGHECAALAWPLSQHGEAQGLALVIVNQTNNEKSAIAQVLNKTFNQHLPDYMRPKTLFWTDTLPTNINGKIDIKAIQQLLNEHAVLSTKRTA